MIFLQRNTIQLIQPLWTHNSCFLEFSRVNEPSKLFRNKLLLNIHSNKLPPRCFLCLFSCFSFPVKTFWRKTNKTFLQTISSNFQPNTEHFNTKILQEHLSHCGMQIHHQRTTKEKVFRFSLNFAPDSFSSF